MISGIFIFIAVPIALFFYMIYTFRWYTLLLFIVFMIFLLMKVVKEYKVYGLHSIFRAFQPYPTTNEQLNLVEFICKRNKGIHITIPVKEHEIISVSKSGVFLIRELDYIGKILGKEEDKMLTLQTSSFSSIPNFFWEVKQLEKCLKQVFPDLIIKKIIIKKGTCMIMFPWSREFEVLGLHNLYYHLQKLEKKKIYTEEKVKEIASSISNFLSNDVKLDEKACASEQTKLQSE